MKVDIHTHILPSSLPDMRSYTGYGGWQRLEKKDSSSAEIWIDSVFFRKISENCWNPEVRLQECQQNGIGIQVLSTVPVMFNYWAKPEHTLYLCHYLNNHLASVVSQYPEKFIGLGTLPMQDPILAVKELEQCMKELKLSGVEIGTHVNGWNLDEEVFYSFYEKAEELQAVIFVHPWDMMGQKELPRYFLPWLVSMPAETSRAICSLIFGGIFERFPNLKIIFAHGGGAFPMSIGRIEQGFFARPDLCQIKIKSSPKTYLKKIYVDSLCHDPAVLTYLIQLLGEDRIALGSDYPFPLGEANPGAMIENMGETAAKVKEQILSGTALELFGHKDSSR